MWPKIVILRADLKETNTLLLRIATALELYAGITQPGEEAKDTDPNIEVGISTEAELILQEWNAATNEPEAESDNSIDAEYRKLTEKES